MGVGGISNLQSNDIWQIQWVSMTLTAVWQAPFEVSPRLQRSRRVSSPAHAIVHGDAPCPLAWAETPLC